MRHEDKFIDPPLSPEELDRRLVVVNPRGWIALALTFLLILGALAWAIFGQIPNTLETSVILLNESGFEIVQAKESGVLIDLAIKRGETVKKGQVIGHLENKGKKSPITTSESGLVIEVFKIVGGQVNYGDSIAIIEKEKGNYYFFGFLPIDKGDQVQKGMKVYIQPAGIDVQESGSIIGKVAYVSPYVVSRGQLISLLGDESLIPYFTQNKAVIEVMIEPLKNPDAPSGYLWTSGLGPKEKIRPLTLAKGLIVLESRRPISYVIPVWHVKKITFGMGRGR